MQTKQAVNQIHFSLQFVGEIKLNIKPSYLILLWIWLIELSTRVDGIISIWNGCNSFINNLFTIAFLQSEVSPYLGLTLCACTPLYYSQRQWSGPQTQNSITFSYIFFWLSPTFCTAFYETKKRKCLKRKKKLVAPDGAFVTMTM